MGPNPPLLIVRSPTAIHLKTNDKRTLKIRFPSKRLHTVTKINDNININSTIAGSKNAISCII
jgi:hypothetical protein